MAGQVVTATLNQSDAARKLAPMLPPSIQKYDLMRRENSIQEWKFLTSPARSR